ncbi:hypothetical protein RHSIM_Rhsim03G0020000 [Rhododendron simsii]|uniref:Uncharacterized protein n=1 Tax=Rhododendron simsii TaxID=118357 RepID=A0A834LU76_RHOSS|nr:hypothetical protein RHSIM_Rhsim03G0020000 [Rhododendron simsii]
MDHCFTMERLNQQYATLATLIWQSKSQMHEESIAGVVGLLASGHWSFASTAPSLCDIKLEEGVLMSTSLGDPYSPKIHVQSAFLSLNDDVSSAQISTLGEITFNVSKSSFSTLFHNNTKVSLFYRKQLLSTTVTDSFPHDKAVREKMAKAVFPRSSTNVKRWVSDKMAKDLNSSAPVEFSFLTKAKGSLELPGEERRGFDMTIWCPGVKLEFDAKTRVG